MRFSSLFQNQAPQAAVGKEVVREEVPAQPTVPEPQAQPELPEDLADRVRLVGEWQLFGG